MLGGAVPGLWAIGHFIQRMKLAQAMDFESYGPCPDLLCSLFCWCCTYSQDDKAIKMYQERPKKSLVGEAMGAMGNLAKGAVNAIV